MQPDQTNASTPANSSEGPSADADQEEDRQVIELLRTPGLSIKYLDEPTREKIRRFIRRTHIEKGVALMDVAKMIGNKTSGYTSWLTRQLGMQPRPFEEARLKAIKEKRRKYERRPFDGTKEDRTYLLALCHGDISVTKPWTNAAEAIRVSTSTTHPAMAELFSNLFSPYGHVYKHPRYKKDTQSYEWNLFAVLDGSFVFLREEREAAWKWIAEDKGTTLSYLAGVLDAEGSILLWQDKENTNLSVSFFNTNVQLLSFLERALIATGYTPGNIRISKREGARMSKYKIPHRKDYWQLGLSKFVECQSFLKIVPLRHREKIQKAELAVSLSYRQPWSEVQKKYIALRECIHAERDLFVAEAERVFKASHQPIDG
jgi:hypothetical protein